MLLSIYFLRAKDFSQGLPLIQYVITHYNETSSVKERRLWQRDYIERLQHEAILAHMIVPGAESLQSEDVEAKTAELINQNVNEVYNTLGNALPGEVKQMMLDVTDTTVPLLTTEDQLALSGAVKGPEQIANKKRVVVTLRELGWRLVCDPDAFPYKQWVSIQSCFTVLIMLTPPLSLMHGKCPQFFLLEEWHQKFYASKPKFSTRTMYPPHDSLSVRVSPKRTRNNTTSLY